MKKIYLLVACLFTGMLLYAQPPAGKAEKGAYYGRKITPEGALTTAQFAAKMNKMDTLQTKVTGTVVDVCPKKGCWWTVELPDKTTMFVKSKDYDLFVPTALKGKTVVLEGVAFNSIMPVSEAKHYEEDANKPKDAVNAIVKPQKKIRFQPSGVLVL